VDVFQHGPEFFPETTEIAELRPPDPLFVSRMYRRLARMDLPAGKIHLVSHLKRVFF
jgi:hypothetical protein